MMIVSERMIDRWMIDRMWSFHNCLDRTHQSGPDSTASDIQTVYDYDYHQRDHHFYFHIFVFLNQSICISGFLTCHHRILNVGQRPKASLNSVAAKPRLIMIIVANTYIWLLEFQIIRRLCYKLSVPKCLRMLAPFLEKSIMAYFLTSLLLYCLLPLLSILLLTSVWDNVASCITC